jgi:hypothetical protein
MMRALLILFACGAACTASAAQPLGRLFFSPLERAQLDAARARKEHAVAAAAAPAAEGQPPSQVITYSGIVRRSDGKSILWLNNRPAEEKDALRDLAISGRVERDGAVTLLVPQTGGTLNLKVGQRAELQTGKVAEARPAASAPETKNGGPDKGNAVENKGVSPSTTPP